jgi:D-alanyl-D-alanine carboxypeptidase
VTIHQLLTHTGGTGDIFGPEFIAHRKELKTLKDYIALFGARDTAFRPGIQFQYSNYGYIILGRVIEAVSGKSYYDYVRERIFVPAGMTSTDSPPEDAAVDDLATGYTTQGGPLHANTETLPYRGSSAGGGYSTVGDMIKFADALAAHKLLDAENTALMTTGKVEMNPSGTALYGYGFGDVTEHNIHHIGHNGGAPGMGGDLSIFPRSGYAVAVLSNNDPPVMARLAGFIATKLPQQ